MKTMVKRLGTFTPQSLSIEEQDNPTPNVPLIRKMVEWVEAEEKLDGPERTWDQERYVLLLGKHDEVCRTNCCVAGQVAIMQGTLVCASQGDYEPGFVMDDYGRVWSIPEFAQREMGLNWDERRMFSGSNDVERIRYYAEKACARAGETL